MSKKEIVVVQSIEFEGAKSKLSTMDHALTRALEDSFDELQKKIADAYRRADFAKKEEDPTVHFTFESEDPTAPVVTHGCYIVATVREG